MAALLIRLHFPDCFVQVGGPSWSVRLVGRRDSTRANRALADGLPRADQDLPSLIRDFDAKGLNERDMVALSG
ncbi:Lignin-forming anionic peroxidase [Helianthus anomalus]